jgi:hypothetical protein
MKVLMFKVARKLLRLTGSGFKASGSLLLRAADAVPAPEYRLKPIQCETLARNIAFKERHKGRRAFVIANGPSLRDQDLTPLGNEVTFAINLFYQHPHFEKIRPKYYSFSDHDLFDDSAEALQFHRTLAGQPVGMDYFVPLQRQHYLHNLGVYPADRLHYFYCNFPLAYPAVNPIDLCSAIPFFGTVAQFSIMLAVYMGCNPIYLIGFDHDWVAKGVLEHFMPNYYAEWANHRAFKDWSLLNDMDYRSRLRRHLNLWDWYETLGKVAARQGSRIFNATPKSFLDVYEWANYEEVLSLKAPCLETHA